jgi:hypothetical protein
MSETIFSRLKLDMAQYQDCSYTEVQFPMVATHKTIGFTAGASTAMWKGMALDGRTYILYRLGSYIDRKKARGMSNEPFVKYVNQQRKWQESEELSRHGEKLIVAEHKGMIHGLLTHYNPISHRQVVEMVEKSTIYNRLSWYSLSPKDMTLGFSSKYVAQGKAQFGLAIKNGETGHVTLGYHLYVKSEDYIFFTPLNIKRRHLSKVNEAYEGLEEILRIATEVEVDQVLINTPATEFLLLLSDKKYDKIKAELYGEMSADELVSKLFRLRDERGYKVTANHALDAIFALAFKKANE